MEQSFDISSKVCKSDFDQKLLKIRDIEKTLKGNLKFFEKN